MSHFEGKDALKHVVEKKALGTIEIHGTEMPGHLSAGLDAARDVALVHLLVFTLLHFSPLSPGVRMALLGLLSVGLAVGKFCRAAWLAWSRLERLHRIMDQERYEIEHHRGQEREELAALYEAKGFTGKLLDQVVDVLMANGDRLLRVMLEEELGLTLEGYEHPLKQGLGAFIGAALTAGICLLLFYLWPSYGVIVAALFIMGAASSIAAKFEGNRLLPAFIWYAAIGALCLGIVYFAGSMAFS